MPVLLSLASWDPSRQGLNEWLTGRLSIDYPALTRPAPASSDGSTCLAALLHARLIILILDGLDEIADEHRGAAISEINRVIRPREQLVVSCRASQYRKAVQPPPQGIAFNLHGAAGIELRPLNSVVVTNYLRKDAAKARSRWDSVVAVLGTTQPAGQALTTPLMVGLARAIFNPRPDEGSGTLPHPAELIDPALSDRQAVERYLFNAFIPAVYRPYRKARSRRRHTWSPQQAERYLTFLARHLEADLGWWDFRSALAGPLPGVGMGLAVGLVGAVLGGLGAVRHSGGFAIGITVGLAVLFTSRLSGGFARLFPGKPAARMAAGVLGGLIGGSLGGLIGSLVNGVVGGIAVGIFVGAVAGISGGIVGSLAGGLVGGFVVGILSTFNGGVAGGVADGTLAGVIVGLTIGRAGRRRPAQGTTWSKAGIVSGLGIGLAVGIVAALTSGVLAGIVFGPVAAIAAGFAGAIGGAPVEDLKAVGPNAVLIRDRRTFLTVGSVTWLAVALVTKFMTGLAPGNAQGAINWVVAIAFGLGAGLLAASVQAAWGAFAAASYWQATRGRLPWRLMSFLADAHERGALRQEGAYYQFRHPELRDHLKTQA